MHSLRSPLPFSLVSLVSGATAVLVVSYIGLIAVVVSYATLTVEFSQSVRNDEAIVATLESKYLTSISHLTNTDYVAAGYTKPFTKIFVQAQSRAAVR